MTAMRFHCPGNWPLTWLAILVCLSLLSSLALCEPAHCEDLDFTISEFIIQGNTVVPTAVLQAVIQEFLGTGKRAEDVEAARSALEKYHQSKGFPTVVVNIPEQAVGDGKIRLQVIEGRIREVRLVGSKYFTRSYVMTRLTSLQPGKIIYLPSLQEQLSKINANKDLKIAPVVVPTQELGLIDIELEVKDQLPLSGRFELSNRSTPDTTPLRLNLSVGYDNLWQANHSISFQYQISPQQSDEVLLLGGSYVMPSPFHEDQILAVYGIKSSSDKAFGQGFSVLGAGKIIGGRYIMPLPSQGDYYHNVILGLDYKDFAEDIGTGTGEPLQSPVAYLPFSVGYSSTLLDAWGSTAFSLVLNMSFRGLVADQSEFEIKRFRARGNYIYFLGGIERELRLPYGFEIFAKVDGQLSDQPLISNEQYSAGGIDNLRGYLESEILGDNAFHSTVELSNRATNITLRKGERRFDIKPFLFYDRASLWIRDPQPGEDATQHPQGVGFGVTGDADGRFDFELDVGRNLARAGQSPSGLSRVYFRMGYNF